MLHKVRTYINRYALLPADTPVLVGLSGGADSVALLGVLVRLGYRCMALHCNFHLRGEESDRDQNFSESVAKSLDVPFYTKDFDTHQYAREKQISIEMAARELRYGWFENMRKQTDAQAIAVAHHRDDNSETLLLNLIRGSGIRGMRGMLPKNGFIIRPLLGIGREEILHWLQEENLQYIVDSTNLSDEYTRNFIRLRVIPLLEKINPSAKETIARTAEHLAAAENIYLSVVQEARDVVMKDTDQISIDGLMKFPSPETILYELLAPYHFTRIVTEEIFSKLNKESGKTFYSSTHRLIKDRKQLLILPLEKVDRGLYFLSTESGHLDIPIKLSWQKTVITNEFTIEKEKQIASFDYDKLRFPLILRKWKAGDWFVPFGMNGRKKLSDYFSDRKFSLADKEQIWLLCSGDDIIWIVGERADNRYRINNVTKYVLTVNFSDKTDSNKKNVIPLH